MLHTSGMPRKNEPERASPEVADLGERFRQARKAARITQEAITEPLGISQGNLSKFERGSRGFELSVFLRLVQHAATLGIDVPFVVLGPRPASQEDVEEERPSATKRALGRTAEARAARDRLLRNKQVNEATRGVRKPKAVGSD